MKANVSALIDGELDEPSQAAVLDALCRDRDLRRQWEIYCAIGDCMRGAHCLSPGFTHEVMDRLAVEPTVVAPVARRRRALRPFLVPVAASVAGVALVAWVALRSLPAEQPREDLATTPLAAGALPPSASAALPVQAVASQTPVAEEGPPPAAGLAYLLAHQGYSPSRGLQGVTQYLRVVSESGAAQ